MSTSTTTYHPVRSQYLGDSHADEFADIIDSLGRLWNPLKHPRDRFGRFIRTFSSVKFNMPDSRGPGTEVSGRAVGIDRDGSLLVKVTGVGPNAPDNVQKGQYVKVPHDKVEVQTIKAQLNTGAAQGNVRTGRLADQEARSVTKAIERLRNNGMPEEADKLQEALDLSMETLNPKDPKGTQAKKDRAIDLYREVAEAVDDEKGKNFKEGDDLAEVKATLPAEESARLEALDSVVKTAITARLSVGGKVIADVQNDQGPLSGKAPEVRIGAAENELEKDFTDGVPVWDITSGTTVQTALQQPQKATISDSVREQQGQKILPALRDAIYQQVTSGRNRLAGHRQGRRVAPADRWHVDKDGEVVGVGSIVHVDASTTGTAQREEFTGTVARINIDTKGKKTLFIRQYDPENRLGNTNLKGKPLPYKDHNVTSASYKLATVDEKTDLNKQLALLGDSAVARSLTEALSDEFIDKMQRRFAGPGAKRTAPTGGSATTLPTQDRVKVDINGEMVKVDDKVMGPNGEVGTVLWISGAGDNTVRVEWPNGQVTPRITSRALTRLHGSTSATSLNEKTAYNDNMYAPTRDEAADILDEMGAGSVAEAVRSGGDDVAIKNAMQTDAAFQAALPDAQELYKRKNETLAAGQELSAEDRAELGKWDRVAAASMGQFREPNAPPPTPPEAPQPEEPGQRPQNPANTTEVITEDGGSIRTEGDQVVVNEDTEDPIPQENTEEIDAKVEEGKQDQPPPEEPPAEEETRPALAQKLVEAVTSAVEEAKQAPNVTSLQRALLDQKAKDLQDAVKAKDADAFVTALRGMQTAVNRQVNANLRKTKLAGLLNGRATGGVPLPDFVQQRVDAGIDIFSPNAPALRERPPEVPDVVPEGVDKGVDSADAELSEGLLSDDGSARVMVGDEVVDEGFYVVDPASITSFDDRPTADDIAGFLNDTAGSDFEGVSLWFDEADGSYKMARVSVHPDRDSAAQAAQLAGANQFVDISDGSVHNIALGGNVDAESPESIEDPRSEERSTRVSGTGSVTARTTAKQKNVLDHLTELGGEDPEIARITQAVRNGEEITGADASRLADFIGTQDASKFDKPSDKGVAAQMADRLARAAGETGARGYSSQATALRRTSDVAGLLDALSQNPEIQALTEGARADVKSGDNAAAADKFRQAADLYDALGNETDMPARRAREHADRLDAAKATTPGQQTAEQAGREALDNAGMPTVQPITKASLSNPETPRTRPVSAAEFAELAVEGQALLEPRWDGSSAPTLIEGQTFETLKELAFDSVQEEWGGITVDAHTAQVVEANEGFALTIKHPGMDTVSIPIGSSREELDAALDEAAQRFGGDEDGPLWLDGAHIGVFRNEDTGMYEIDPVLILDSVDDVERIGAYTNSVGGAFNYADGLGYWPPYIAEGGQDGGQGPAGPGEVARPGGQVPETQPGVGTPQEGGPAGVGQEGPATPAVTGNEGVVPPFSTRGTATASRWRFSTLLAERN